MSTNLFIAFIIAASCVAFTGDGAVAMKRGLNVEGTYKCQCSGGTGSCTASTDGGNILLCSKGSNGTCTGKCVMSTTSTGATIRRAQ
jgi:hypothetical protein